MTVVLALSSALMYGLSDFLGGLLSRRTPVWQVAFVTQVSAAACLLLISPLFGGRVSGVALAWGALSGVGSGVGTAFLFRGLATGRMSVVAPVSAVGAAVLPVLISLVLGQRPSNLAWVGILGALPAIWLIAAGEGDEDLGGGHIAKARGGLFDGVLAGIGFGLLFVALGQVPQGSGLLPAATGLAVSVIVIVALASVLGHAWLPRDPRAGFGLLVGVMSACAAGLYQFAAQSGLLAIAAVLTSLYPGFTVLLAVLVLREGIRRGQLLGLALAAAAVALVAAG